MDISLIQFMRERIEYTSTTFHRYLYNRLDWGRQMLGLVGPRGVGKTTMFLQYIKEHQSEQNMLYVSADYVYFHLIHLLIWQMNSAEKEVNISLLMRFTSTQVGHKN